MKHIKITILLVFSLLIAAAYVSAETFTYDTSTRVDRKAGPSTWKKLDLPVSYTDTVENIIVTLNFTDVKSVNAVLQDPDGNMVGRFTGRIGTGTGTLSKQYVIDSSIVDEVSGDWRLIILAYGKRFNSPVTLDSWDITIDNGNIFDDTDNDDTDNDDSNASGLFVYDTPIRVDKKAGPSTWKTIKLPVNYNDSVDAITVTLNFTDIKSVNAVLINPDGYMVERFTGRIGTGSGTVSKQYDIDASDIDDVNGEWTLKILAYGKRYTSPVTLDSWTMEMN